MSEDRAYLSRAEVNYCEFLSLPMEAKEFLPCLAQDEFGLRYPNSAQVPAGLARQHICDGIGAEQVAI
jgi:hypothetical protein